jgi:hypothetical protein
VIVLADIVDWNALGEVIVASLIAGVGVTLCFSLALRGAVGFTDMRRAERPIGMTLYALLGLLGLAASLLGIAFALIVMTSKG